MKVLEKDVHGAEMRKIEAKRIKLIVTSSTYKIFEVLKKVFIVNLQRLDQKTGQRITGKCTKPLQKNI
tara:strand:- start:619 stop:822 length:204 start_codon:yes stop_codon:yes gene_type:complete